MVGLKTRGILLPFLAALVTFLLGIFTGAVTPFEATNIMGGYREAVIEYGFVSLTLYILLNNVSVAFIAVIGGYLLIPPFLVAFLNGFILGSIASTFLKYYTLFELLMLILPHGVFEIPAMILACSVGIRVAVSTLKSGFRFDHLLKQGVWVRRIVMLLVIAAVIEAALITLLRGL